MSKMTHKALVARDAKRDLGAELLASVREMKAGHAAHVHQVSVSAIIEARMKVGLSQADFAEVLGVSPRTVQDWEQGRRHPTGPAKVLIRVAKRSPEMLRDLIAAKA
jgi:putative transcriptional regulator